MIFFDTPNYDNKPDYRKLYSKADTESLLSETLLMVNLGQKTAVFGLETLLMVNVSQKTAFFELETKSQIKIPPKASIMSLKSFWFQRKYQNQILKPLWFHKNYPLSKVPSLNRLF